MIDDDPFARQLNQDVYDKEKLLAVLNKQVPTTNKDSVISAQLLSQEALKEIARKIQKRTFTTQVNVTGLQNLKRLCNELQVEQVNTSNLVKVLVDIQKNQTQCLEAILAGAPATRRERLALAPTALKAGKLLTLLDKVMPLTDSEQQEVKEALKIAFREQLNQKKGFFKRIFGSTPQIRIPQDRRPLLPKQRELIDSLIVDACFEAISEHTGYKELVDIYKNPEVEELAKAGIKLSLKGTPDAVVKIPLPTFPLNEQKLQRAHNAFNKVRDRMGVLRMENDSPLFASVRSPSVPTDKSLSPVTKQLLGLWVNGSRSFEAAVFQEQKEPFRRELDWLSSGLQDLNRELKSGDVQQTVTKMSLGKAKRLLEKGTTLKELQELKSVMQDLRSVHLLPSPWQLQEMYNEVKRFYPNPDLAKLIANCMEVGTYENLLNKLEEAEATLLEHIRITEPKSFPTIAAYTMSQNRPFWHPSPELLMNVRFEISQSNLIDASVHNNWALAIKNLATESSPRSINAIARDMALTIRRRVATKPHQEQDAYWREHPRIKLLCDYDFRNRS